MTQLRTDAWISRLEAQFLRPYRWLLVFCLLGLFAQSLLLLPIPLLQGWVLDCLLPHRLGTSQPAATGAQAILIALLATVACHLARMGLAWRIASVMGRISQEVVVALRGALHRKLMRLPMAFFDAQ
jgi:ABC-type multidrug transport system fused ATPase/permease subunit